jgi:hypothetical protein
MSGGEIHGPEPRVPTAPVAAITHGVARVAVAREKGHVGEPNGGAAEAAMGEEKGGFRCGCGGGGGEGREEFEGARGSGDRGAGYAVWKGMGYGWIGRGSAPLEGEGAEGHCVYAGLRWGEV